MAKSDKLIHRDDLDFEAAEEITSELSAMFPGMKVVFAGDESEIPADIAEDFRKLQDKWLQSFGEGRCADCGEKMPCEWPPTDWETFNLPGGWGLFSDAITGDPSHFICAKCNKR